MMKAGTPDLASLGVGPGSLGHSDLVDLCGAADIGCECSSSFHSLRYRPASVFCTEKSCRVD